MLMLTILLTFTQKVTAFAPVSESENAAMIHCDMSATAGNAHMVMEKADCSGEMSQSMDCQSDCEMMTVVSVLYFVDHEHKVMQPQSLLAYQYGIPLSPHYFPESLYRPPFLS